MIRLQVDPRMFVEYENRQRFEPYRLFELRGSEAKEAVHDACSAAALLRAIEEAETQSFSVPLWGSSHAVVYGSGKKISDWIRERASVIQGEMLSQTASQSQSGSGSTG